MEKIMLLIVVSIYALSAILIILSIRRNKKLKKEINDYMELRKKIESI